MTDPVRRDDPARSTRQQVAFVVAAGVLWATVIVIDDFIQSHETPGVAKFMWQPGSLFRSNPVLEMVRNLTTYGFMIGAPIFYRDRYAGTRWIRDAFVAMLAVYAIGFCILAPLYHAIHHTVWTMSWLGVGAVACVLCSIFSVFWAWVFTTRVARVPPKRPFTRMSPPIDRPP
jgi:hypothetical protein